MRYGRYGGGHRRYVRGKSVVVENSPFAIYIERVECEFITFWLNSLRRSNDERRAIIISNILRIVAKILERLL